MTGVSGKWQCAAREGSVRENGQEEPCESTEERCRGSGREEPLAGMQAGEQLCWKPALPKSSWQQAELEPAHSLAEPGHRDSSTARARRGIIHLSLGRWETRPGSCAQFSPHPYRHPGQVELIPPDEPSRGCGLV